MRMIDADALKKKVRNECLMPDWCHVLIDVAIANMPTIEERKKGKWLQKSKPLEFCTEWWYECSECGSKPPNDRYGHSVLLTDYCPNCGADMRGGEK